MPEILPASFQKLVQLPFEKIRAEVEGMIILENF